MQHQLEEKIRADGKKQKWYLWLYRKGERWKNYGGRAFWPIRDMEPVRNVMSIIWFGGQLLTLLLCMENKLAGLLIYAAIHLAILITGLVVSKVFDKELAAMQEEYRQLRSDYYCQLCQQYGIQDNRVYYDDVVIGNGFVSAPMRQDINNLQIYQLGDWLEKEKYKERKRDLPRGATTINDYIASLEFRNKFWLETSGGSEKEWLKYLKPSLIAGMARSNVIGKFLDLRVEYGHIYAKTERTIDLPEAVDVYQKKKLSDYFWEAERYCKNLRAMTDEAYQNFAQLDFLRG